MRELTAQEDTLIRKSLLDSGQPIDGPKEVWLAERAILQRRIKNQRRALKRLNGRIETLNSVILLYRVQIKEERTTAYRHAAKLAETFWFGGRRAAAYIRKWC